MLSSTARLRALACALAFLGLLPSAPAGADTRYNVLLVSIDSLRRDMLGCYGARLPHAPGTTPTPRLDAFAASGVQMLDAITLAPWTLPAHVSLMTGRSPVVHQVETDLNVLGSDETTLAEMLRARGYRTAGVFSGPYLEPHWGFGRGFERYRAMYGEPVVQARGGVESIDRDIARARRAGDTAAVEELGWKRRRAYEHVRTVSHADVSSERVTAAALEDLDRLAATQSPWLLFVHYFDVHYDYLPPAPFDVRFDPEYAGTMSGHGFFTNPAVAEKDPNVLDGFVRRVSDRDLEHLVALYAGEAASVDAHVGRLLDRLDAKHLGARTLVIVVSDHGDEFFEHGGIGHRRNLHEEVLRIPMLARLPGVLPAGRAFTALTTLADVVPSVLDLIGVPPPRGLTGRSVMPILRGEETGRDRTAVARLVRAYDGEASIDGTSRLPVRLASVQEAFEYGGIKIFRRRDWPLYPPGLPEDHRRALQAAADRSFRRETMVWLDLKRSPAGLENAASRDFDDPRAHRALQMYRRRYRELLDARVHVGAGLPSDRLRDQLEGLGYVETSHSAPASPRDGFTLPLPGNVQAVAPP